MRLLITKLYQGQTFKFTRINWPRAQDHPFYYIGIYAAIGFLSAGNSVTTYVVQFTGGLKASRSLFERLLVRVTHATMRWYDVTPQGQSHRTANCSLEYNLRRSYTESFWKSTLQVLILTCPYHAFSKDIETIDGSLVDSTQSVNWALASLFAGALTIA